MNTDKLFDLAAFIGCLEDLREMFPNDVTADTHLTAELIHSHGAVRLGTMLVGSDTKAGLYTTDDDRVLARAPLPYTRGLMWLEGNEGLEHQHSWVVGLHRLQRIKQLSLLAFPVRQGQSTFALDFNHTRFMHTYDVITHGLLCAHNAQVVGKSLSALTIALVIHDLFTAACGDLMKFVNYKLFDEDARLSTLLSHKPYVDMCEKLGVDPKEPLCICQQKEGTLCQIRDFADTIAYTARDLSVFLGFFGRKLISEDLYLYEKPEDQLLFEELLEFRDDASDFALLWEDLITDEHGNLVFTNSERLEKFLRVRAILFRVLYYNRQTRNVEYLLGIRLVKILLEEGVLHYNLFQGEKSDEGSIWWKVFETTGYNPSFMHDGQVGMTCEFDSFDSAKRYVESVTSGAASKNTCGLIYKWPSQTKSKVNYWRVTTPSGVKLWGEAFPEKAAGIESIMRLGDVYHVAVIKRKNLRHINQQYWLKLKGLELSVL